MALHVTTWNEPDSTVPPERLALLHALCYYHSIPDNFSYCDIEEEVKLGSRSAGKAVGSGAALTSHAPINR